MPSVWSICSSSTSTHWSGWSLQLTNDFSTSSSSNVDAEVSKLVSKPTIREQKKSVFMPTCHLCGVVGHIRPNCSLLRQKPKSEIRFAVKNIDVAKFVLVGSFVVSLVTSILTVINCNLSILCFNLGYVMIYLLL